VDIYMDGELKASLNFNVVAARETSADGAEGNGYQAPIRPQGH